MLSYLHIIGHIDYRGMSILLQQVPSLRSRTQANAPAASYWLRRILDDGWLQD